MSRPRLLTVVLLGILLPRSGAGQVVPTLDVGVASLGYVGTARATAVSLTPAVRREGDHSLLTASATFSQFDGGDWSAQGALAGSLFTPAWRALRGEAAATAGAIAYRDLFRSGEGIVRARAHLHGERVGGWLGAGSGVARHGIDWNSMWLGEGGLWAETGRLRITTSLSRNDLAVTDRLLSGGVVTRHSVRGAHMDLVAHASWTHGPLELDVLGGARTGGEIARDAQWASAGARVRLTTWLLLIGEVGGEPEVVSQRLPEGRYGLLAVRMTPAGRSDPLAPTLLAPVSADFVIGGDPDAMRTVRVREPRARRVELRGDFTDWNPVALRRAVDGTWQLQLRLAPGVYRVMIRVDDGPWRPPSGVPAVEDEFGNMVGMIVVR
ncbi:MAG TPA: glycogen-binding domain-containing protein [Gemmatimonadaceae bacterium]|nr:glycogen-binding domain-containing protein [Gemmatimonadaceae bacterium]